MWVGRGLDCAEDPAQWHLEAAKSGDAVAQMNLASKLIFQKQQGKKVTNWIQKSAKQGYAPAMSHLGLLYLKGDLGLPKSEIKAKKWLEHAAAANDALALLHLGKVQMQAGREQEAIRLWKLSAKEGLAMARTILGEYASTQGNFVEASHWYEAAGTPEALWSRATLEMRRQKSVETESVLHWVAEAARVGHKEACDRYQQFSQASLEVILECLSLREDRHSLDTLFKYVSKLKVGLVGLESLYRLWGRPALSTNRTMMKKLRRAATKLGMEL